MLMLPILVGLFIFSLNENAKKKHTTLCTNTLAAVVAIKIQ